MAQIIRLSIPGLAALLLLFLLTGLGVAGEARKSQALEVDFQRFLPVYIHMIKQRDAASLAKIHPDLPKKMYGFFFDMTENMMQHAENKELEPSVTCKDYGVCTVTWPQPNDSWAAQSFIRQGGKSPG